MKSLITMAFLALSPGTTLAQEDTVESFIASNLIATLYHELGHALIDQMGLPVFGQEEDAADVLSVLMIDAFFEEDVAVSIALDTAFGFYESAEDGAPAFWDVHGPDLQRYYTTVCLFYGANPDEREDIAQDMGLPYERAEGCEEEFELANDSWGPVLDDLTTDAPGTTRVIQIDDSFEADLAFAVLRDEVEALNADFALPDALEIRIDRCGEANAWYSLEDGPITVCTEYVAYLTDLLSE